MKPIGPLMIEHKLIERMVSLLAGELRREKDTSAVDTNLIVAGADFFRVYADRTHHGKEEEILFKELAARSLSEPHRQMMERLIQEHVLARDMVRGLATANDRFTHGQSGALKDIIRELEGLVALYPAHIEREDKHFFVPAMEYFSQAEQQAMLDRFWEFDRTMIHEKYRTVVEALEQET